MRILFLGDIVGEPGRKIVRAAVPLLRSRLGLDLVVANAENAAGGSGLNPRCFHQLVAAGVDAFTMGDHIYRKKEILPLLTAEKPICKPANFPSDAPGPDVLLVHDRNGAPVAILSLLGRLFMRPVDCPFAAADRVLARIPESTRVILVDVHAEATSDKQTLLRHLVGRVSAVVGTHTHVPTADEAIYPPGTAYITDLGMTGPYDSIIGRRIERVLHTARTFEPRVFDVATGDPRLSGVIIDVDAGSGAAQAIQRVHLDKAAVDSLVAEATPAEPPSSS